MGLGWGASKVPTNSKGFVALGFGVIALLAPSCSSTPTVKIEDHPELSRDMPDGMPEELQDRYRVKDSDAAVAYPSRLDGPPGSESPKKTGPEKSKKGKKPAAAPPPFRFVSRRPAREPIWTGEKITYRLSYFAVPAGWFSIEAMPHKEINSRKVYHIRGTAHSYKVFDVVYRINDLAETFIDYDGFFSHRFQMELDESKQLRKTLEINDPEKAETFYWNRQQHFTNGYKESKETKPITAFSQDTLSALYFLRTIPLNVGEKFTVPIVSEGNNWEADVTVIRKEIIDTPLGSTKTIVVRPLLKFKGALKAAGDSYLWLTDDDRRMMVRLEAKLRVGTLVASATEIELGVAPAQANADARAPLVAADDR